MSAPFLTQRETQLLAAVRYLRNGIRPRASNRVQRRMLDDALSPYSAIETPGIPTPVVAE
jgi:hypothetical protein